MLSHPPIANEPNSRTADESDPVIKKPFAVRKENLGNVDEISKLPNREPYFLGKCKPGINGIC